MVHKDMCLRMFACITKFAEDQETFQQNSDRECVMKGSPPEKLLIQGCMRRQATKPKQKGKRYLVFSKTVKIHAVCG